MSKAPDTQRKALGKGLSALLPQKSAGSPAAPVHSPSEKTKESSVIQTLPISRLQRNPNQPRQEFDLEHLKELAQSIKANGIIQPIVVRPKGDKYEIVAGERRWRAAQIAELKEVPVHIREVGDDNLLELALIENIQREDLNPIETAKAFEQLANHHGLSHEAIAERTGKDRTTITNFLRLLKLSSAIQKSLIDGEISAGHARAILGAPTPQLQVQIHGEVVLKKLSVRQTEALVKKLTQPAPEPVAPQEPPKVDPNIRAALDDMAMALGTRVRLSPRSDTSGKIEIEYYTKDDLERIYSVITQGKD